MGGLLSCVKKKQERVSLSDTSNVVFHVEDYKFNLEAAFADWRDYIQKQSDTSAHGIVNNENDWKSLRESAQQTIQKRDRDEVVPNSTRTVNLLWLWCGEKQVRLVCLVQSKERLRLELAKSELIAWKATA